MYHAKICISPQLVKCYDNGLLSGRDNVVNERMHTSQCFFPSRSPWALEAVMSTVFGAYLCRHQNYSFYAVLLPKVLIFCISCSWNYSFISWAIMDVKAWAKFDNKPRGGKEPAGKFKEMASHAVRETFPDVCFQVAYRVRRTTLLWNGERTEKERKREVKETDTPKSICKKK